MVRIKICGINSPAAIDAAVGGGADWLGFVFFPPSPRYVTASYARELAARHPDGPPRVGLFVDPTDAMIAEVLAEVDLDILQIHGMEAEVPRLRTRFGRPIWRAAGIAVPADLPRGLGGADALLLDAKPPPGATRPGGNAERFDWTLTKTWRAPGPWVLAGGLDPNNVATAILLSGANAIDVSSGVERAKGVKDPDLIRAFIDNAREGQQSAR
jgi:phosphoribosylanthranilate isomerase